MATKKSINAAKALVRKYRSITLEQLREIEGTKEFFCEYGRVKARKLTSFSSPLDCPLCVAAINDCSKCIYGEHDDCYKCCYSGENKQTYFDIVNAKTDEELLIAFKNRADHIESIINKLEKGV